MKKLKNLLFVGALVLAITLGYLVNHTDVIDDIYAQNYNYFSNFHADTVTVDVVVVDKIIGEEGDISGLNYFGTGEELDTIFNLNLEYTSNAIRSLVFVSYADTIGTSIDSTHMSTNVWAPGSCLVRSSQATTVGTDTLRYAFLILQQ